MIAGGAHSSACLITSMCGEMIREEFNTGVECYGADNVDVSLCTVIVIRTRDS